MIQVVTIDGPAGAGKSSVARRLAERLGWCLLDTGAMYRAVTLAALRRHVDLHSAAALADLVARIEVVVARNEVMLDGEVVTAAIRTDEVTRLTRHAADCPAVRRQLVAWQRAFAEAERQVVAEGRDQGTIVFPDALKKYYLTANDEERARRRQAESLGEEDPAAFAATLKRLRERDAGDHARTIAPLVAAHDARVIDSTGLALEQVVSLMEHEIRTHLATLPDAGSDPLGLPLF